VVVTEVPGDDKPEVPMIKPICGKRMFWSRVPNVEIVSASIVCRTPDFKIGADTFVTFVAGNTQSFADNGFDFDGTSLKGTYYYCVTSVSFWDHESEASEIIQIDY